MSFKFDLYQEKGKAKTLARVISCNDLGIGVGKMYQMLHQQWATKRRLYNVSGGAAVVLKISEDYPVPFELGGNFQRLVGMLAQFTITKAIHNQ